MVFIYVEPLRVGDTLGGIFDLTIDALLIDLDCQGIKLEMIKGDLIDL